MREKTIEQKLVAEVKKRGGIAPKWVAPGFDGVPDRLVFLPGRHFAMVEVKAPGEKPRPLPLSPIRFLWLHLQVPWCARSGQMHQ